MASRGPEEAGDWGEYIRSIKREKISLGWDPKKVQHTQRVTTFQKTREERLFDPVLQRFRVDDMESTRRQHEQSFRARVMNRARQRQLKYGQAYDIINHKNRPKINRKASASKPVTDLNTEQLARIKEIEHQKRLRASRVDYNILSNMSTQQHHWAPPSQRPPPLPKPRHGSGPAPSTVESSATLKRDYNIVSGRYINNHKRRTNIDQQHNKDIAATRYWQTHDFNPVSCAFYDKDKEDLFLEAREEFENAHGDVQRRRLPPKIQNSEGYLYNIVSMTAKDKEGLARIHSSQRHTESSTNKAVVEARIRKKCEARYDLEEQRKLNRVAAQRFEEMTKNGFDLVTGQPYHGNGAKVMYRPSHMAKEPSAWQKATLRSQRHSVGAKSVTPSLAKRLEAEPSNIIRGDSAEPARSTSTARNSSTAPETSSAADTAQRPAAVPKLDLTASASTRSGSVRTSGF